MDFYVETESFNTGDNITANVKLQISAGSQCGIILQFVESSPLPPYYIRTPLNSMVNFVSTGGIQIISIPFIKPPMAAGYEKIGVDVYVNSKKVYSLTSPEEALMEYSGRLDLGNYKYYRGGNPYTVPLLATQNILNSGNETVSFIWTNTSSLNVLWPDVQIRWGSGYLVSQGGNFVRTPIGGRSEIIFPIPWYSPNGLPIGNYTLNPVLTCNGQILDQKVVTLVVTS